VGCLGIFKSFDLGCGIFGFVVFDSFYSLVVRMNEWGAHESTLEEGIYTFGGKYIYMCFCLFWIEFKGEYKGVQRSKKMTGT